MKDTKRRLETFSFFDHDGIIRHLEKMAKNGWMIEKCTNFGWIYRRIEPKTVKFAVSYYPKASEFDPEPTEEQKTFHEFCAHTGWALACTSAQMQIFYNERENPTPIETEPALEVESIHASAKKNFLPSYLLLLLCSLMNGGLFISGLLGNPIDQLASPTKLFTGFCFLLLFTLCTVELICYFHWHSRAKKAARQGEFLKTPNTSGFQKGILIVMLVALLYWMVNFILCGNKLQRWIGILMCFYIPALILAVNSVKNFLKRRKVSRGVNRTLTLLVDFVLAFVLMGLITFGTLRLSQSGFFAEEHEETYEHGGMTWIVHQDVLPLTVEDLVDVAYDEYIRERRGDESLLLAHFEMTQRPRLGVEGYEDIPRLTYRLVGVKLPFLYEMCRDRMICEQERLYSELTMEYKVDDAAPWGANEVYRLYAPGDGFTGTYLLCYDRTLVEIRFEWEPTPEQMQIVGNKLNR